MSQLLKYQRYILFIFGILFSLTVRADSWDEPKIHIFFSDNKEFKLIISPSKIPFKFYAWEFYNSNKYPQTKKNLKRKHKFMLNINPEDTTITPCKAELYKIIGTDSVLIWRSNLLNDICPVHALVANDGSSIATFDNWYSSGYGFNTLVIYNDKGQAKKTYKLEEISPFPLNEYMKSISSLHWNGGELYIDNNRIEITFLTENKSIAKRIYNLKKLEFEN